MDIYTAMLGGVFISSVFVFCIWINVFVKAWHEPTNNLTHTKLMITSIGLIINSLSILMVMVCRIYGLFNTINLEPFINACYAGMVFSDLLFLMSASIGKDLKYVKIFCCVLFVWFTYCGIMFLKG
jgi:hypothetical protein